MVGERILVRSDVLHAEPIMVVTLRGVEYGGIWIESQEMTNELLNRLGAQSAPRTPVFFLPFAQIHYMMAALDMPALGEKAFGV
jgi:hypothetical protein